MKQLLLILICLTITGCSSLNWVRYADSVENTKWQPHEGMQISRGVRFVQPSFRYEKDGMICKVYPKANGVYPITVGPPFLPIIPFIPQYLFPREDYFELEIELTDSSENKEIDLRMVRLITLDDEANDEPTIYIERDSLTFIQWRLVSPLSSESEQYVIHLSRKPVCLRVMLNSAKSADSVSLQLYGIISGRDSIAIPELTLERKGKFWYEAASAV
jgi:hypothetical protein